MSKYFEDAHILRILRLVHAADNEEHRENTQRRRSFLRQIKDYAEGGKVAVVWGGMDCDGSAYEGVVRYVEATKEAVEAHIANEYEWADGPCSFYLTRPSEVANIEESHRDLAMEAYEDGHSWVIYR